MVKSNSCQQINQILHIIQLSVSFSKQEDLDMLRPNPEQEHSCFYSQAFFSFIVITNIFGFIATILLLVFCSHVLVYFYYFSNSSYTSFCHSSPFLSSPNFRLFLFTYSVYQSCLTASHLLLNTSSEFLISDIVFFSAKVLI